MIRVQHDQCGAPVIRLSAGAWIHALPVTLYHVERFVWETAPENWDASAQAVRPSPWDVLAGEDHRLWAGSVTLDQCARVARWLGGRLPSRTEWQEARTVWGSRAFAEALVPTDTGDARISSIVDGFRKRGVSRRMNVLSPTHSEFATEYRREPLGAVFLLSEGRTPGIVTDFAGRTFRDPDVGFSVLFDSIDGS